MQHSFETSPRGHTGEEWGAGRGRERPDGHVGLWVSSLGKREGEATLHKGMNLEVGLSICFPKHRVPGHVHIPLDSQ